MFSEQLEITKVRSLITRILLIGFDDAPKPKQDEFLNMIQIRSEGEIGWEHPGFRKPQRKSPTQNYSRAFFDPALPSLYDYHIVVVSKEAVYFTRDSLSAKKDDLLSLMQSPFPSTLVVPIIGGNEKYEDWVPSIDRLKQGNGTSLKPREKHWAYQFMRKYQKNFSWRAHGDLSITSYDDQLAQRFIATNITDNPVAFESPLGNGRTIFLPFYDFATVGEEILFIRDLLDHIETRYRISKEKDVPPWVSKSDYRLPTEDEMDKQAKTIEHEKAILNQVKSILWLDGIELVDSVAHTLTKLGVRNVVKEAEGRHDIEILEQPQIHGILEVKGLSAYANHQDIRQLEDWYIEARKEDENVKGIFVLNDFKEIEPQLRKAKLQEKLRDTSSPFTKDALRIASNDNFCLLTTYQLFQIFRLNAHGNFDKSTFLRKLKDTSGVFT